MKLSKRRLSIITALLVAFFLLVVFTPSNNQQKSLGSSYNYSPDGYAAWYQYMSEQGRTIQRWQKPLSELSKYSSQSTVTLLIVSDFSDLEPNNLTELEEWIKQGNRLVLLGFPSFATAAPFTTLHQQVKIETTRRIDLKALTSDKKVNINRLIPSQSQQKIFLQDEFGPIVIGGDNVIFSSTPFLGANAYPKPLVNYEFLAQLVQPSPNYQVLVDEYIHGYKDQETLLKQKTQNVIEYLQKTPLYPVFIQLAILLFIVVIGLNIRLSKGKDLPSIKVNNSQAYITALADVLEKGENRDLIIETISKEEQRKLQKALGLGTVLVKKEVVYETWQEQTQRSAKEIKQVLEIGKDPRSINDAEVIDWLKKWQSIHAIVSK